MPPLPAYQASYKAVYFEPMSLSGERFTVGILVQSENEYKVIQTISAKTLKCMYGSKYQQARNLIMLVLDSAKEYLKQGKTLSDWQPIMGGFYSTETRVTRSSNGIDGILFQAITLFSSLYSGVLVDGALSDLNGDNDDAEEEAASKLITSIRSNLGGKYQDRFHKSVDLLKGNTKITVDYLGVELNAAISNFDVKAPKTAFSAAKVKLFDLERLREQKEREKVNDSQSFEMIIGFSHFQKSNNKDYIEQLKDLGSSIDIKIEQCETPKEIAESIRQSDPS